MKKFVLLLLVLLIAAGAAGYVAVRRVNEPFRGYEGSEQFVDIPAGSSTRAIGDALIAKGVIRDEMTYRLALWVSGDARRLQAGEYRYDHPMTPRDVLGKIARGEVYTVAITFPEGLTIAEMSKIFEAHGFGTAASFVAAAKNPAPAQSFDPKARDLEGYVFPDTYNVPRRTDATALVHLMVERFEKVLSPELRQAAADRGLTVRQLVTLASIVEKETGAASRASRGRGGVCQQAQNRHAAPVRSHGHLRARTRRQVRRQSSARRSDVRFAVQHVSVSGPAAGADRFARKSVARSRGSPG